MNLDKLKKDKMKLKELIIVLRDTYDLSFRKIGEKLQLNREKTRRIYYQ